MSLFEYAGGEIRAMRRSDGVEDGIRASIRRWIRTVLQEQGVAFDLDWMIAEFVTFWRSRARPMASWQQAFRNNVLQKLARGMSLAPPKRNRAGPGSRPNTRHTRIWDRSAELRKQRLADFDQEARDIVDRSDRDGRSPDGPMGKDD